MFQSISVSSRGVSQTVVLACFQGQKFDDATKARLKALNASDAIDAAMKREGVTGDAGEIVEAFATPTRGKKSAETRVLMLSLGTKDKFESCALRNAGGAIGRRLAAAKATGATLAVDGALKSVKADMTQCGVALGEGLGLLGWTCDQFKGKGSKDTKRTKLAIHAENAALAGGLSRGLALADAANLCRTLSQTPPNIATTSYMAAQAKKLARATGMKFSILKGKDLVRERMEGLINVGKASENEPCLVRLEYAPKGRSPRGSKPLVLVGKTLCYDSGGLSLKINNGMVGMKRDKDGGCAVLGAMQAIATTIKPSRRVVALLAIAENSISDEAFRPDDVLTYRNGVTVEVTNTDAEGRLVLADALCWACDKEDPAAIVDLATLTGGVVVALGSTYAGMFCEDDKLRAKIEAAGCASGERVWRLPMHQEYRDMMKSPVADIVNSNANRKAHPIQGAAFLSYFVDEKVPWCHLDIAGVHVSEKNAGPFVDGPNGWGVRLLANLAEGF